MFISLIGSNISINENKNLDISRDVCTAKVTVDCEGDGIPEATAIVDCKNANAMMNEFAEFCR